MRGGARVAAVAAEFCDAFGIVTRGREQLELREVRIVTRYFRLLALINGWPAPESLTPALDWPVTALRLRAAR
jgi:hypothetical protein